MAVAEQSAALVSALHCVAMVPGSAASEAIDELLLAGEKLLVSASPMELLKAHCYDRMMQEPVGC